jgi:hypothetical protein
VAGQRGYGSDVDDRRAGGHQGKERLHSEHRTSDVHGENAVPILKRDVVESDATRRPGIVDQAMELLAVGLEPLRQMAPGGLIGDVQFQSFDAAHAFDRTVLGGLEVNRHDDGAGARQRLGLCMSLALGRAGDHDRPTSQPRVGGPTRNASCAVHPVPLSRAALASLR